MKQLDIFSQMRQHYKITKPIRLIELFAGIGSQAKALQNLNANFEHYRVVEYDKYPVISYNAIHGTNFATSDITKISGADLGIVDTDKYEYIMTYSFPCQDLSLAGNQKGMSKGSGTRSGLLWEVERLLTECNELPQVLLMENVPDVIGTNNIKDFNEWQNFLEKLGYSNYVEILNAKDYTIPQNRRRAFMVSVLGNYSYEFPPKVKLQKRLKDLLESKVDEKYYLSDKMIEYISKPGTKNFKVDTKINMQIARPVTTDKNKRAGTTNYVAKHLPNNYDMNSIREFGLYGKSQAGSVYNAKALCPNITTGASQNWNILIKEDIIRAVQMQPKDRDYNKKNIKRESQFELRKDNIANSILTNDIKNMIAIKNVNNQEGIFNTLGTNCGSSTSSGGGVVVIPEDTKQGYALAENGDGVYIDRPHQKCGVVQKGMIQTIKTQNKDIGVVQNLRIRKLTPKECWRLMGFTDTDFDKASKVNSNAQLYKQAGNSIVVQVLEAIFKQML